MLITVAKGRVDDAGAARIERFLEELLPRVEAADGVVAAYHYRDGGIGESTTLIVWRDAAAVQTYRRSDVIAEIAKFEEAEGLDIQRGLFEMTYPTSATVGGATSD